MVRAFALLLGFQWLGEILARVAELSIPGPVLGLVFLLILLGARARLGASPPAQLPETASGLLAHLSLLFVPAGVGVLTQLDRLAADAVAIAAAVVVGTLFALGVTGWAAQRLMRGTAR